MLITPVTCQWLLQPICVDETRKQELYITVPERPRPHYYYGNGDSESGYWTSKILGLTYACSHITFPLTESNIDLPTSCAEECTTTLQILSMQNKTIPPLSFIKCNWFNVIYLENLQIESLHPGAFSSLNALKELYLSKNDISEISDGVLDPLHNIEILDLSSNRLKLVSEHFLSSTKNLKLLNLSRNFLCNFDGSLMYSERSVSVDISFNSLIYFNINNTFSNISHLNISHNELSNVKGCYSTNMNVYLRHNKLQTIQLMNCQNKTPNLEYLDLGENFISEIPYDFVEPQLSLLHLFLDHNNLTTIPQGFSEQFPLLISLNMSYNNLISFDYGSFDHFKNLQLLDLSHNKLTSIKRYFHALTKVNKLYLDANKLNWLDSEQLSKDLPQLTELHVDENDFSCENLIEVYHTFVTKAIILVPGKVTKKTNVHGIACLDTNNEVDIKNNFEDLLSNKLAIFLKNESSMYEYFNRDFKNSSFYKYLENLQYNALKFNETEFTNYFNNEFKNSTFYQYLEGLHNQNSPSSNFNESLIDFFNKHIMNSSFITYLEDIKKNNNILNDGLNKSKMYNFFNGNFPDTTKESSYYFVILCTQAVFLFFIMSGVCFVIVFVLRNNFGQNFNASVSENIALCETSIVT